jgi:wyosine [tRNA(Phe)-imidazoG37] synthetase (radical SAM superfamily)
MAALARSVAPDRIHLNTAVRPPAEKSVAAVGGDRLAELAGLFTPAAAVVAEFRSAHAAERGADEQSVMALLGRHAATLPQMQAALGGDARLLARLVRSLLRSRRIRSDTRNDRVYYRVR